MRRRRRSWPCWTWGTSSPWTRTTGSSTGAKGCRRLYGFDPEEVRGRLTDELLQTRVPQPLEQNPPHAPRAAATGRAELTRRRKDGSEVVVAILWALRRDAQGRPTAILEVSTDITEQESAGRAIRRQAALIDLSPDATIVPPARRHDHLLEPGCRGDLRLGEGPGYRPVEPCGYSGRDTPSRWSRSTIN